VLRWEWQVTDDDDWWSKDEACARLEISTRTFETYVQGGMPVVKIRRQVFVRPDIIRAEYRRRKMATKATRATPRSA
jgi:hypothetical protein